MADSRSSTSHVLPPPSPRAFWRQFSVRSKTHNIADNGIEKNVWIAIGNIQKKETLVILKERQWAAFYEIIVDMCCAIFEKLYF